MTNNELKEALQQRFRVTSQGVHYAYISAIIYRVEEAGGPIKVTVELKSISGNSVSIAKPKDVAREGTDNA